MTESTSPFYSDSEFVRREGEIEYLAFSKNNTLQDANARRHCKEGFWRRHGMIETSRFRLQSIIVEERERPLDPYAATEAAIHLNAYYLNLRGAFDNLAWCLQYEWKLLGDVNELSPKRRGDCNLWGKRFSAVVRLKNSPLATSLHSHATWATELARFRDPAAHRIPLYVIPAVITTEAQLAEFQRLDSLAGESEEVRGGRSRSSLNNEARSAASYQPLMTTSDPDHLGVHRIPEQFADDHEHYLAIAEAVLTAI